MLRSPVLLFAALLCAVAVVGASDARAADEVAYRFEKGRTLTYGFEFDQDNDLSGVPGAPDGKMRVKVRFTGDVLLRTLEVGPAGSELEVAMQNVKVESDTPTVPKGPLKALLQRSAYRLTVDARGRVLKFAPPENTPPQLQDFLQSFQETVRQMLPPLPPGSLKPGVKWNDTRETALPLPGGRAGRMTNEVTFDLKAATAQHVDAGFRGRLRFDSESQPRAGGKPIDGDGTVDGSYRFDRAAGHLVSVTADGAQSLTLRSAGPDDRVLEIKSTVKVKFRFTLKP